MINITKSVVAPNSNLAQELARERRKTNPNYRNPIIVQQVSIDFFHKCYLCESDNENPNIEHFIAHQGNHQLMIDWNNLFWACSNCNNLKRANANHNNILDCTNSNHLVEEWIIYKMDLVPRAKVHVFTNSNALIDQLSRDIQTKLQNTLSLLDLIYNASPNSTQIKTLAAKAKRKQLVKELRTFSNLLFDYEEETDQRERAILLKQIRRALHRAREFAAFKRWIIRDSEEYMDEFGEFLV